MDIRRTVHIVGRAAGHIAVWCGILAFCAAFWIVAVIIAEELL